MHVRHLLLAAGFVALTSVASLADPLTFTVTSGLDTATFSLDSNPTPTSYIEGNSTFFTVPVTFNGTTTTTDTIVFGNSSTGISFADLDGSLFFLGSQLYTGTEDAPMFAPEVVNVATATGDPGVITITAGGTAITPEPSSFLLLGTGLLGASGIMRRPRMAAKKYLFSAKV